MKPPNRWFLSGLLALLCVASGPQQPWAEQLRLSAKDPANWQRLPNQGQGLLTFDGDSRLFQFQASQVLPNQEYALVQHQPGNHRQGYIIARLVSDPQGRIDYQGQWSLWQGKIWLVLEQDVAGQAGDNQSDRLTGWHPHHYLFEEQIL